MSDSNDSGGRPPGMASVHHYGAGGMGILGANIAVGGYIYPSLALPTDAGKEYYAILGNIPAGLTFDDGEAGDFEASAPDGTYIIPWDLYENGNLIGSTTQTYNFGVGTFLTGANSTQGATSSTGAISVTPPVAGIVNLAGASAVQAATSSSGAIWLGMPTPAPVFCASTIMRRSTVRMGAALTAPTYLTANLL